MMVQVGRTDIVTWYDPWYDYRPFGICYNIKREVAGCLLDSKDGRVRKFHHLILQTEIETWQRKCA